MQVDGFSISISIWAFLLLTGGLNGFILALLFFKNSKSANLCNLYFASFLTAISYILTVQFLHESRLILQVPHFLATSTPFLFLLGPLFYLYAKSILNENFSPGWIGLLHFIPFILCIITIIPFYSQTVQFKFEYLRQSQSGALDLPATRAIYYGSALAVNGWYWYLSKNLLSTKKTSLRSFFRVWLSRAHLLYGFSLIVYLSVLCIFIFTDFYLREVRYAGYLLLSLSVHFYGYLLLKEARPLEDSDYPKKYSNSNISSGESKKIRRKLLRLIDQEKPYLDSNIKLKELADLLQINPNILSQTINNEFDVNFNEFLNNYRFEEAKEKLRSRSYDSYSLEGIARESGFGNRTSFYRVFKKRAGITPSQYRQENGTIY